MASWRELDQRGGRVVGIRLRSVGGGFERCYRLEELLFAVDERIDVVGGEFEAVAVSNRVGGTRLDAVAAENTSGIIDVVGLGVAFGRRDPICCGIFGGFDVDAICRARCCAQKTRYAFFESLLVTM